jgi:hypothetical protein
MFSKRFLLSSRDLVHALLVLFLATPSDDVAAQAVALLHSCGLINPEEEPPLWVMRWAVQAHEEIDEDETPF